jgi:hypothetical protein
MSRSTLRRKSRGAAAIEFALWLPILLMFVSIIIDWGFYMTTRVTVARGVMEGARRGAAQFEPTTVPAGSQIVPRARARTLQVLEDMGITCTGPSCLLQVTYCDTGQGGPCQNPPFDGIVVQVTLDFEPFFGFVPTPDRIQESFEMAVENQRT